jgi:hypothetical protein
MAENSATGQNSSIGAKNSRSASLKFRLFMELKGSLPCSQQLSTGTYRKPDESSPHSMGFGTGEN